MSDKCPGRCPKCGHNPATDHLKMQDELAQAREREATEKARAEKAERAVWYLHPESDVPTSPYRGKGQTWIQYAQSEFARANKLQEKLDRLYDSGLDGPQLIDDSQAFGDRIDEFRGDQSNPLALTEQRELAEWWAERGTLVMDLDDKLCAEMARAEKVEADNAEYKRHLGNALYQAKEVCPDYPWSASPTMSEIAWAVCSTLEGTGLACDDWAADAKRLRETLGHIIIEAEQAMSVVPGAAEAQAAREKRARKGEG